MNDCWASSTDYVPNRNYVLWNGDCVPCNKTNPYCLLQQDGKYWYCGCEANCWGGPIDPKYFNLSCPAFEFYALYYTNETIHHCKVLKTDL